MVSFRNIQTAQIALRQHLAQWSKTDSLFQPVIHEVAEHQRSAEQQEPATFVDLSKTDRREAELLRETLDGVARILVVARDEYYAAPSTFRRVLLQDGCG
jgi:hypothetical protein